MYKILINCHMEFKVIKSRVRNFSCISSKCPCTGSGFPVGSVNGRGENSQLLRILSTMCLWEQLEGEPFPAGIISVYSMVLKWEGRSSSMQRLLSSTHPWRNFQIRNSCMTACFSSQFLLDACKLLICWYLLFCSFNYETLLITAGCCKLT